MRYSFGDSSESPFTSNFLELLRDAIDFAVYVLQADQRIQQGREAAEAQRARAEAELVELEALRSAAQTTIKSTAQSAKHASIADCAGRMIAGCDEAVDASVASAKERLADELAHAAAEEANERGGACNALLALLAPHVPPESSSVVRLNLLETGGYQARREGVWPGVDLSYNCELVLPSEHLFANLLRIDNIKPRLEIGAPEHTGWIKKEIKIRPQHLERHVISEAIADGTKLVLRVRAEPSKNVGFDFETDIESGEVSAVRIAYEDELVSGPFDLREEDSPKLLELCQTVYASLTELKTTRLLEAKLDGSEVRELPKFQHLAERIVSYLAPFVREIAKHSLEPDELVLRHPLGDDRREEIFVSKTTLRQKYDGLPSEMAGLFASLGLNAPLSRSLPPAPSEPRIAITRSELPPSNPPPPPALPVIVEPPALPTPSLDKPAPQSVEREIVPTLQKIIELSTEGRHDDAFRECAALLERTKFVTYDQGEQRKALKVLLAMTGPQTPSYVLRRAYRAGRDRAKTLAQKSTDPLDYELLGLCQLAIDESAAAGETFRQALELERSRNPESELCARLAQLAARHSVGAAASS